VEEKTFFENGDVKVTNARFITGEQTYAMSNVTSVKTRTEPASRVVGYLFVLIGIVCFIATNWIAGLICIAIGAAIIMTAQATYHVMLSTAGGETSALKTKQIDYINKVVTALNDAIVHRG